MAAIQPDTVPLGTPEILPTPPSAIGRFQILHEIGRGSNGVVYSAQDPVLGRELAIKAIPLTALPQYRQQIEDGFINEARAAGRLNHAHIVTIFDAGRSGDLAYIAMERLQGRDLHDVLATGQKMTLKQVVSLMTRVADAVHYAHKRGLIHRDIKPSNIFLLRDGKPKVLDFGVALTMADNAGKSEHRKLIGTPNYMSPEQALGQQIDRRSDIFSLGIILYELLCGRRAFDGKNVEEILAKVVAANPTPLEKIRSDIPAALLTVVRRAMTKDIDQRYQSAGEMRNDLAAFSGSITVMQPLAEGESTAVKRRLSRRELTLLGLLILALGGLAWQFSRSGALAPERPAPASTARPPAPAAAPVPTASAVNASPPSAPIAEAPASGAAPTNPPASDSPPATAPAR
jgi:serine/threonine-protein kinase